MLNVAQMLDMAEGLRFLHGQQPAIAHKAIKAVSRRQLFPETRSNMYPDQCSGQARRTRVPRRLRALLADL